MKKSDIVSAVRRATGLKSNVAQDAVNAVFDFILHSLAENEPVLITGFGTFKTADKGPGEVRNPKTGDIVHVPAHARPHFTFSENVRISFRDGKQSRYIMNPNMNQEA